MVDLCNEDEEQLVARGPQRFHVRVRRDDRESTEEIVLPFPRELAVAKERARLQKVRAKKAREELEQGAKVAATKVQEAKSNERKAAERADALVAETRDEHPHQCRSVHYLNLPGATDTTEATYLVTVVPSAESDLFHRRDLTKRADKDDNTFEARIRTRGLYGFGSDIRVFFTIPVSLVGVRFPASPSELSSSSSSRLAQISTLSAGLLIGMEPWDYRFARSKLPLPVRPQAGFHVVDVLERNRGIAALAGVTTTVPALDIADTVSLNVGVFYENDLREDHPLLTGHRLLFTSSINFLASPSKGEAKK